MQLSAYQLSVLSVASALETIKFVIVGANDGKINDPAYPLISGALKNRSSTILIEPNSDLNSMIRTNYAFTKNKCIINAAVGEESDVSLYSVKPDYWDRCQPPYAKSWPAYRAPTGITSTSRDFVADWINRHKSEEFSADEAILNTTVVSKSLPSLLSEHQQPWSVDVLQVDAESNDDNVIYACDLGRLKPSIIYCEVAHLDSERTIILEQHLRKFGYRCLRQGANLLSLRVDR